MVEALMERYEWIVKLIELSHLLDKLEAMGY